MLLFFGSGVSERFTQTRTITDERKKDWTRGTIRSGTS